jgi:D-alanine-D-alanine ligase-like ATP-grasp enzyme
MQKIKLEFEDPKKINLKEVIIGARLLIEEALKRGIKVSKPLDNFRIFEYRGERHLVNAQETDQVGRPAVSLTHNKQLCREFLNVNGISVPKGNRFKKEEFKQALAYFKRSNKPVVCKPVNSDYGTLVFLNVDSEKQLKHIFKKITKNYDFIIEEQFVGTEIRVFATEKGYVCANQRTPANVVGDGKHNIKQLVEKKNQLRFKQLGDIDFEKYALHLDKEEKKMLRRQKKSIRSILDEGDIVLLRDNSNLSTGGDSMDITDELHPSIKKIAIKIVQSIPCMKYAGIDIILNKDISKPQNKDSYRIIEVNNMPGIYGHHMPHQGTSRNPAGAILDMLFPKSK